MISAPMMSRRSSNWRWSGATTIGFVTVLILSTGFDLAPGNSHQAAAEERPGQFAGQTAGQTDRQAPKETPGGLVKLPPGTRIPSARISESNASEGRAAENQESAGVERWNQTILLAQPKIATGDVDALPNAVKQSVSTFVLTILATVQQQPQDDGSTKYLLRELGLGYSVKRDGELQIVSTQDARPNAPKFNLTQRLLLGENERRLADVRPVARTTTFAVFDTPTIMHRNQEHQRYVTRHFVWIDSRSGECWMLVWLLEFPRVADPQADYRLAAEPMRLLPAGTREVREIHVDKSEFSILGVPSELAFALEELPPGKDVAWTDAAKLVAAAKSYDAKSIVALALSLNAAVRASVGY